MLLLRTVLFTTVFSALFHWAKAQYAIRHVSVIPMDKERVLQDQTVLIANGKIMAVGSSVKIKIPSGYQEINASGKYLIPGLMDMHTHFFYEQGNNNNTCDQELKLMLANGITTARIQCGDSVYLEAKKNVQIGKWIGPDLYVSSPQFVGRWPWPGKVFAAICTTPKEAEDAVKKFQQQGYDEIKITFMVKADVYDAIIKTAKEVGIKVTGHVGPQVKLPKALLAKEQIEHMDEFIDMLLPDSSYNHGQSVSDMNIWRSKAWETVPYLDESKIPALVQSVKEAGIFVTPTNFFFFSCFGDGTPDDSSKRRPDYQYIPAAIKTERWDIKERYWKKPPTEDKRKKYVAIRKRMTHDLWKAGVKLMAGSDSPEWFLVQGFSMHDELATFVASGLSNFAALETATINPCMYLGIDKKKGTIAINKDADLVLLNANPLEDISNTRKISAVFKNGRFYDNAALNKLLTEALILGN